MKFFIYFILSISLSLQVFAQVSFTDVTSISGTGIGDGTTRGISFVDFNNDGWMDLFVPTAGNIANKLYINNGNGTYTEIAAAVNLNDLANTITCSWADFDNDGDIDLVTTATGAATRLWRNNRQSITDTTFTSIETSAGISMTGAQMPSWADYNKDGWIDFYSPVSGSAASPDALYRNNGNNTFTNMSDSAGVNVQVSSSLDQAIHWGDFNKDGYPDLFMGNLQTGGPSYFFVNDGDGTFTSSASTFGFNMAGRGSQWVDYNNDGLWDFSFASYPGGTVPTPIKLFRNNGNGTFSEISTTSGITDNVVSWGVTWADYDNNGYEDCFVTVSGQSTNCILYANNGDGTFTNVTTAAGLNGLVLLHAIWGDINNDGWIDLYSSGSASVGNKLFKNNGTPGRHWVQINLNGIQTNRSGVGCQVIVKAGNLRMIREVNTGVGYRSVNQLRLHFGLNANTVIDSIIVKWQRGMTDVMTNVVPDKVISITEGSTIPVELISFTASASGKDILLNWTTATETNNKGFELQRRTGENDWEVMSFIDGNGTTISQKSYSYQDKNLSDGSYYYRLKQIDFDGTENSSNEIEAIVLSHATFGLEQNYPNPFNPSTKISFKISKTGLVTLKLFDLLGKEYKVLVNEVMDPGVHEYNLDASNLKLSSGVYFYRLTSGGLTEVKKLIYQK